MNCNGDCGDQINFSNPPQELAVTAKDGSLNLINVIETPYSNCRKYSI